MSTTNSNNIESLLQRLINSKQSIEDIVKELEKAENAFSNGTSLQRLNELKSEFAETTKNLNDLLNVGNNKKVVEEYEKFLKIQKQINEKLEKCNQLEKAGLDSTEEYLKLEDESLNLLSEKYEIEKNIVSLYGDMESASELYEKYSSLNLDNKRKELELTRELNRRMIEGTTILDDQSEIFENRTKALKRGINEISKGTKQIYQSVTKTLEPWSKANHAAMQYAKTMGMSQKTADSYLKSTVSWASKNNIGLLFNKTSEELIKMQGKYSEVLGRNVQLTSEQKKDMLAMEAIIGEDNMMDIANNLENFGMGMSDSAAFVKKTFDTATKSGIAASKLTKTIQENIKRAQNYTFKNGLDGLTSMAKKAIQLKTDLSLVDGFIDKTSTVEGAISTGANLQVLGGSYAMGSDPLSMLYDSLNNVEGIFDRAVGMAQGKVFYNEKTGNFEMGAMDRYMMKQAATQMGIDPSKMIDVAFRKASLDKIEGQVKTNKNISNDKEMVELIKNLATWDNGQAVVNIDGKDKAVSALTKDDKSKLEAMQRTDSQNLQEMAINLRSMHDIMSGIQKETDNEQANINIVKDIGEKITNYMKNSTGLLNVVSKIGAWGKTIFGLGGLLGGIWTSVNGILITMRGVGNLNPFKKGAKGRRVGGNNNSSSMKSGIFRNNASNYRTGFGQGYGLRTNTLTTTNGKTYQVLKDGRVINGKGVELTGAAKASVLKNAYTKGTTGKGWTNFAKAAGKGLKAGGITAAITAGVSLATDIASGEFKKDMGKSIGKAAGPAIGSIIGGVLGGPVGAMIGSTLGGMATQAIQDWQKNHREKVRKDIADRLSATMPNIAGLFEGPNALSGNYKEKHLRQLEKALNDGVIDSNDNLSRSLLRKLRANDDLTKIKDSGINVNVALGNGGIITNYTNNRSNVTSNNHTRYDNGGVLHGKSHADGGMPILGSNIVVEGGEFVINKKATKLNLPLLEKINSGEFIMRAKEPLGKQMQVNRKTFNEKSYSTKMAGVSIEPITINLSGTIKLDSGSRNYDISNEVLNNPQLITKLTEMINKQLNILDYGAYNKGNFKQKFT